MEITLSHPHLVRSIGLCNVDAKTTEKICQHLLNVHGKVGMVSNQIQYSLIDQRPKFAMSEICNKYGLKLITYGTFVKLQPGCEADRQCGGLLSDKWIDREAPNLYGGGLTTSQRKVSKYTIAC